MPILLTCEGCGKRVRVPEQAGGQRGRCPACGHEMIIPAADPIGPPAAEPMAAPAAVGPRGDRDEAGHVPPARREANAPGIASLVVGMMALLIAWIPLLGLLAWPLGGIGLVLGLVGLILAVRNRRWGTTSAIAGLATNGAAAAVATAVTFWAGWALQDAARRAPIGMDSGALHEGPPASPGIPQAGAPEVAVATPTKAPPRPEPPDGTFAGQDRNRDGRLNADEVPGAMRARFAELDANGDGYVEESEWDRAALSLDPDSPPGVGRVMAHRVYTAADDFIVDVWHNGRRVPDEKREMVGENYGATAEKIEIEVREGDWLVFNVANNRLRWDGASYFGAAGINDEGEGPRIAFATDPTDGRWSCCDDPARVPAFIAHRDYLADHAAQAPANPWGGGDGEMRARVPDWSGRPIWGRERTTWLKFVARPAPAARPGPVGKPADEGEPAAPPVTRPPARPGPPPRPPSPPRADGSPPPMSGGRPEIPGVVAPAGRPSPPPSLARGLRT